MLCHTGTSVLLPPPPGYWYTTCFLPAGPGPLHKTAASAFSRSPLGRANTFFCFPIPWFNPPHSSKCFSDCTLFLTAILFLLLYPFFCFCLVSPKLLCGHHIFPVSSYLRPCSLNYAIPPYSGSSLLLSPVQLYQLWLATSFLASSLLLTWYLSSQLSRVSTHLQLVCPQFCS